VNPAAALEELGRDAASFAFSTISVADRGSAQRAR